MPTGNGGGDEQPHAAKHYVRVKHVNTAAVVKPNARAARVARVYLRR